MKKLLALLLALTMVFALAACGEPNPPAPGSDVSAPPSDEPSPDASGEAGIALADLKIGVICLHDENSSYDRNFIDAARDVFEEMGLKEDQYMIKTGVGEDESCYDAAAELADAGCNAVFSDSYGHESYMIQAAQEFPEVQFVSATADRAHTQGLDNFHNAFAEIFCGRFLAGVAAGLKLNEMIANGEFTEEEAKIGYVGAKPYAEVISGYTSFYLGARYVCPTAVMEVIYTNEWYDETLEKEAANTLINNGCKLISEHADSMGAPTACETAGVPNVSYNLSFKDACPNTYLIGSRINWRPYFKMMVTSLLEGKDIPVDFCGTLDDDAVQVLEMNESVAAEGTADKLAEVRAAIGDGSLKVFDTATFTVTVDDSFNNCVATVDADGHLTGYMADVDNDGTYVGETEAVSDGYFHESEYRSAPYFYAIIDGITVIG